MFLKEKFSMTKVFIGISMVLLFAFAFVNIQNAEAAKPKDDMHNMGGDDHSSGADSAGLSGVVVSAMTAKSYTYLEINTGNSKVWVAGPQIDVKVGDEVLTPPGSIMNNFTSKSLNKTFEVIHFVGFIKILGHTAAAGTPEHDKQADSHFNHTPGKSGNAAINYKGGQSGEVLTTMNSGGYTYAEIKTAKDKVWVAGPQIKLKVGDNIKTPKGNLMKGFQSKSMNKTFDSIYFVGSINITQGPKKSAGALKSGFVPKAEGGYTIGELFSGRESLKGKKVKVRGKVTKFSSGIMGKNWVHIVDGTEAVGLKDLTFTTQEVVKKGTIVVAEGSLNVDKEVGGGYFYQLLIEDAKIIKE